MTFEELQDQFTDAERKELAYEVIAELFPKIPKDRLYE